MSAWEKWGKICVVCYAVLFALLPTACKAQEPAGSKHWYEYSIPPAVAQKDLPVDSASVILFLLRADSLRENFPDSSLTLINIALQQSRRIHFQYGIAHALNTLGLHLLNKGLYDSAITIFRQAIPLTQTPSNKDQLFKIYINIGNACFYTGNYERALENYYLAESLIGKNNRKITPNDSLIVYLNIGLLWGRLGEDNQALEALATAKNIASRTGNIPMLSSVYQLIADAYGAKQDWVMTAAYYQKALKLAVANHIPSEEISALNNLSHLYSDLHQTDKAWSYTQQAMQLLEQYPDAFNYDRFHTMHNLGELYFARKEYRKAEEILSATFEKAEKTNLQDIVMHIEPGLAAVYAANGKYRQAFEHMRHYAGIKDTLSRQETAKSLDIWMRARISEKDKAIAQQQLAIAQQKNQLQTKNFWIGGTAIGTLLLLGMGIASVRSYRHKQHLQHAVILRLQQEQELNQLKAQVRGEEQERNRIALELHDGIASQLWAIKLNMDSLQYQEQFNEIQQKSLQHIYRQLDDTTQEVRKTAHNLMPDLLLEQGLPIALASLCEKIKVNTGLEVDFLEYGSIPRVDEEIELSLYRMIQELIQNVLKHAVGATQLLVQLSCKDTLLNITVEDNGAGFDDNDINGKGIGLLQIEKRVKALQGHIDMQSTKGKGTTVYLEFDIEHLI